MDRLSEAAIRRPAVADHHTVRVRPQHRGRFFEAASWLDRVDGCVPRGEALQPLQMRVDIPSALVGADDGTAANGSHNAAYVGRPVAPLGGPREKRS